MCSNYYSIALSQTGISKGRDDRVNATMYPRKAPTIVSPKKWH